jgi:DMSO/TMAO reductase YedYZ heme-binding membrane subunit
MSSPRSALEGRRIILATGIVLAGLAASAALGPWARPWRWVTIATARLSLTLFVVTFAASAVQTLQRGGLGKWLRRNRRHLGLSFATSHLVHGVGFFGYAASEGTALTELVAKTTLVGGSIGYLFIGAMALTSTDGMQRRLGRKRWRVLHRTGMYVLFGIFVFSYLGPALVGRPFGIAAMVGLLGALGLRVAARWRSRQHR